MATPVRAAGFAAGFVTVMVIVAVPPAGVKGGAMVLVPVGAVKTSSVALAAAPVTPFAVVMAPVVLGYAPAGVAVTFTLTVQVAFAGTVPPESATLAAAAFAVSVPVQPAPVSAAPG